MQNNFFFFTQWNVHVFFSQLLCNRRSTHSITFPALSLTPCLFFWGGGSPTSGQRNKLSGNTCRLTHLVLSSTLSIIFWSFVVSGMDSSISAKLESVCFLTGGGESSCFNPFVFSPFAFSPFVFSPFDFSPFVFSPFIFSPFVSWWVSFWSF